jgi:hypothetical protein
MNNFGPISTSAEMEQIFLFWKYMLVIEGTLGLLLLRS